VPLGGKDWRFLVDTGAWAPMVTADLIRAVAGEPQIKAPTTINGAYSEGAYETPFALLLAGVTTDSVVVVPHLHPYFDGVIGTYNLGLFQTVKLDFKAQELELGEPHSEKAETDTGVEMTVSDRRHQCGALMLYCHGCEDDFCISQLPVYCPSCGYKISATSVGRLKQGFTVGINDILE
jgi:hypothetical protein